MPAGVLHELRGGVEAQGLAIQKGGREGRGGVTLEPGGDIDQEREARGMTLGEAILAKALDLFIDLAGEALRVAARAHALDKPLLETLEAAGAFPGGHGAAQPIGLARAEARGHHGKFDDLLLEQRYPQGAPEHLPHLFARIAHGLDPMPAAQVRMHHLALDGPRPNDRDLDH